MRREKFCDKQVIKCLVTIKRKREFILQESTVKAHDRKCSFFFSKETLCEGTAARGTPSQMRSLGSMLSDVFELPFLGHWLLQNGTINSMYLVAAKISLSAVPGARGGSEPKTPLGGLRGQPAIHSDCFSKTTTWRQAAENIHQPILSATVYRLGDCLRISARARGASCPFAGG